MKDGAEKVPSKADEAKKDAEALDAAMKKADLAEAVAKVEKKEEKTEEKKAELIQTAINIPNRFYNAQDGLWMYDTTLVAAEPEAKKEA
jgi:membrane-bound lytic murein transglycosylase B